MPRIGGAETKEEPQQQMADDDVAKQTLLCTCGRFLVGDTVLTAKQVATLLGLDIKGVYEAVKKNELPHRKVGRRVLFSQTALLQWLHGRAVSERTE